MKRIKSYLKTNFKGIMIGIVIGVLLCGTIGVCAATYFESNLVTYDNTESGLNSTDVQGAIDELYNACKTPAIGGDGILEKVPIVTSGDGLYKDEYEDRYFYKGANPNNYITFNSEYAGWRILSIEYDKTIKIIRNDGVINQYYDTSGKNNWARPATLNTYLNSTYYNTLRDSAQNQIAQKNFSIGSVKYGNNDLKTQINNENSKRWNGKIALPTISEFLRTNSNKNQCNTYENYADNIGTCNVTNWMYSSQYWWLLSPMETSDTSCGLSIPMPQDFCTIVDYYQYAARPALYLSSEVKIIGGDGTQNNPYIIE